MLTRYLYIFPLISILAIWTISLHASFLDGDDKFVIVFTTMIIAVIAAYFLAKKRLNQIEPSGVENG